MISVPLAFSRFGWRGGSGQALQSSIQSLACLLALCLVLTACESNRDRRARQQAQQNAAEEAIQQPDEAAEESAAIPPGIPPGYDPDLAQIDVDSGFRVGLLVPLSGPHRGVGEALLNASELALFDIADDNFELLIGDTGGTPEGARAAARRLMDQGVRLLLGPLFATSVESVAEEARFRRVPIIAFSNNLSVASPGVFIMGIPPETQVERIVSFAINQELYRFAVLAPDTAYGNAALGALQDIVFQYGGELVRVGLYDPTGENMTDVVRRLADYDERGKELEEERARLEEIGDAASELALERLENRDTLNPPEYDAILVPAGGRELLTVAPLLAYYDVDSVEVRYLGTALWDDENLGIEPTMQGGWFAAPPRDLWDPFQERYKESFERVPPRVASLGYDATALAAILARQASDRATEDVFSEAALTDPNGFAGIDGIFRFLPEGGVQRVLSVFEVQRNGFRILDPAPVSFEYLGN